MDFQFAGGVWPVMLTPFTKDREIDFKTLKQLVEWYMKEDHLDCLRYVNPVRCFICHLKKGLRITREIKKCAGGRIPVITSGHISYSIVEQIRDE